MSHPATPAATRQAVASIIGLIGPDQNTHELPVLNLLEYLLRGPFETMDPAQLPTKGKIDSAVDHTKRISNSDVHGILSLAARHAKAVVSPPSERSMGFANTCYMCCKDVEAKDPHRRTMRGVVYHDSCPGELIRKANRLLGGAKPMTSTAVPPRRLFAQNTLTGGARSNP